MRSSESVTSPSEEVSKRHTIGIDRNIKIHSFKSRASAPTTGRLHTGFECHAAYVDFGTRVQTVQTESAFVRGRDLTDLSYFGVPLPFPCSSPPVFLSSSVHRNFPTQVFQLTSNPLPLKKFPQIPGLFSSRPHSLRMRWEMHPLKDSLSIMWVMVMVALAVLLLLSLRKPRQYPPGPTWFPVVGCWPYLAYLVRRLGFVHLAWEHLSHIYGPLVGLKLGTMNVVVVSGAEAVSSVLMDRRFDGRPDNFFCRMRTFGKRLGIVFTDEELGQLHRRFCLRHFRDINGLGSRGVEGLLQTEASALVNFLKSGSTEDGSSQGIVVDFNSLFNLPAFNIVWSMVARGKIEFSGKEENMSKELANGESVTKEKQREREQVVCNDPRYLMNLVRQSFSMQDISGGVLGQMPWLRHVIPKQIGYTHHCDAIEKICRFLRATVAEHKAVHNIDDPPEDLIEAYLSEMKTGKADPSFTEEQMLSVCMDLFMAGTETNANTLTFCILLLLKYPECRQRATEELDEVVGKGRIPSLSDRSKCPYVEAFIMEVLRRVSVVPVTVPHRAISDVSIMGYRIPKDTTILINLRSLHMDKDYWIDPENFRPERFINEDGRLKSVATHLLPFGTGRRRCIAESLARSTLYMFLSSILLNFDLTPHMELPSCLEGRDGVTLSPLSFHTIAVPR